MKNSRIRLTSDELGRFAMNDLPGFKAKLKELLSTDLPDENISAVSKAVSVDPSKVAAMLRVTPNSLDELGVSYVLAPIPDHDDAEENRWWCELQNCLTVAQPDDALIIFKKMTEALSGRSMLECASVMKIALEKSWGLQAIEAHPEFFLTINTKKRGQSAIVFDRAEYRAANAFQLLAYIEPETDLSYKSTLTTIHALKKIGLMDFHHPDDMALCIHAAASHRTADSFLAFVEEFKLNLDAENLYNETPLHYAAESWHAGNINILISAGANPRPISKFSKTPLQHAASYDQLDRAMALIDSGAYTADDISNAYSKREDDTEALSAYHAAMMARQAIHEVVSESPVAVKSL